MVKVERTFPGPSSLQTEAVKENGNYAMADVVEQLRTDFHDKCYICEMKHIQDPQIEHLLPHKNGRYKSRMFDWENLFWSCGHCNGVKNQKKYDEDILDCCKKDPEMYIAFRLEEKNVRILPKDTANKSAMRTAQLVNEVFNLKNTGMRVYKSQLRLKELQTEMNILYDKLEELKRKPNSRSLQRVLKALLRRETAFAGFKRCYVREHLKEFPELSQYLQE